MSIFHYYTQITPLENGDHTIWMDYRQKIPYFSQNHWGNVFYNVNFPLVHTNQLENRGHTVWMDYKEKIPKFAWNHWCNGFYDVHFPLLHTNHPLGKRGPHSLNRLQAKKSEICMKPLSQSVLWGRFSISTHKSPPWKTGATQFGWITSSKIPKFARNH